MEDSLASSQQHQRMDVEKRVIKFPSSPRDEERCSPVNTINYDWSSACHEAARFDHHVSKLVWEETNKLFNYVQAVRRKTVELNSKARQTFL